MGERLRRLVAPLVFSEAALVGVLGALVWHASRGGTFDRAIDSAVYARPGTFVRSVAFAFTLIGSPVGATIGALLVAGGAWWRLREWPMGLFSPVAVGVSAVIESVLKRVVARSRPTTAVLSHLTDRSFPSGHATFSMAMAVSAIVLVWAGAVSARRRRAATAVLLVYAVAVCASRLILGVHYLTDVVAGAAIGSGVVLALAAWWIVAAPPSPGSAGQAER